MVGEDTAFGVSGDAEPSLPWHWAALPLAGGDGCWVQAVGMGKPAPACLCQHPAHLAPPNPLANPTPGYPNGAVLPSTQPRGRLPPGFSLLHVLTGGLSGHVGVGRDHSHAPGFASPLSGSRGGAPYSTGVWGWAAGPHLIASSWAGASETYRFPWHGT